MISFDVKSSFTNVPLDETINIILDKIYVDRIIQVPFALNWNRFYIYIPEVAFSFNEELLHTIRRDSKWEVLYLGPLFANVFMCELENDILPQLENHMVLWHRYVDDTFTFTNPNMINNVLDILNTYPNIQLTYEIEKLNKISFLDVLPSKMEDGRLITY